ncbi:MAG: ABC transporter ATP-binding protein [Treponema sp.]
MKNKKISALTEHGKKGMVFAGIGTFFMNFAYMLPVMTVMYFSKQIIEMAELKGIWFYIAAILVTFVVMFILITISYNTTYNETFKEAANLRFEIADVLKKLPLSYFSKHDISDLSETVMQDVADIEHAMSHYVSQAIGLGAFLILVGIMLMIGNWKLGLGVIGPILFSLVLLLISKKIQTRETTKYFNALRGNAEAFQQAIEMHQEIKSLGQKDAVLKDVEKKISDSEKIHIRSELAQVVPVVTSTVIIKFSLGLTIIIGVWLLVAGQVSLLYFLGYLIAAIKLSDSVEMIFLGIAELMFVSSRLKRIKELKSTETQEGVPADFKNFSIEFKDVEFGYNENKVIDGVSFTAEQNQVTALVGPSGCGKTTILRLASRLFDYDKGEILIDGKDIKKIETESLFDKISIVFQDVTLFNTSVMENIRIGNKLATDEQVKEAAKMANCHDFIESMPDGYNSLIGENGSKLSGGERQRISIARAFLKNAPIIILDEISASLDVENEMKIQESLNSLIKGKTVIIISHRLKSIENADKIVVMNNGKVEAAGKHSELLQKSSTYKNMVEKSSATEAYEY